MEKLLSYSHEILNVDVTPLDNPKVHTLKADLTDGAQAFNSLSCHFRISEPFMDEIKTPDAVVHFAGKFCRFIDPLWSALESENKQHANGNRYSSAYEDPRQRDFPHQHHGIIQ